jgi:hypothetical protein
VDGGVSIRPDIDEAVADLDAKGQASLSGLRVPRGVRKGLEKLPELIPDQRVVALGVGKDPAVHPSQGATLMDVAQNTKSIRLLVVTESDFWEVQAASRLNGSRPNGIRTSLADIADVRVLSERKLNRFGAKERILGVDHLRGAQMETLLVEMVGSDETLERFAAALATQVRQVGEALEVAERAQDAPPVSVADELTKLSNLRRDGVLSDNEFEAEKAKLLGNA